MISPVGVLKGHRGWITAIAAPASDSTVLVTASRDKTLIKWDVSPAKRTSALAGVPVKSFEGHSDFVQDVQVSSEGAYALSGSWDNTLSLWDLNTGSRRVFRGHTKDVTSVAFSPCNRQIVSGSRDKSIKVWNTIANFKGNLPGEQHADWVTCVRFSPAQAQQVVVSGGYDGKVKVWSLSQANWGLKDTIAAHDGYISSVCISPDGSLCASGGKDGVASLWDLTDSKKLYSLGDGGEAINAVVFSPNRYWLSVAVGTKIRVYDLESRNMAAELTVADAVVGGPQAVVTCLAWSHDGAFLYAGYTDGLIRVWQVDQSESA